MFISCSSGIILMPPPCPSHMKHAMLFVIFDVEAIFLIPFAVSFTGLPVGAFVAILVFVFLLLEGLVWAWSKGCLQWAD